MEDTGRYTCLASSPAGDDDKEYFVRVHGKFNLGKKNIPSNSKLLKYVSVSHLTSYILLKKKYYGFCESDITPYDHN